MGGVVRGGTSSKVNPLLLNASPPLLRPTGMLFLIRSRDVDVTASTLSPPPTASLRSLFPLRSRSVPKASVRSSSPIEGGFNHSATRSSEDPL